MFDLDSILTVVEGRRLLNGIERRPITDAVLVASEPLVGKLVAIDRILILGDCQ